MGSIALSGRCGVNHGECNGRSPKPRGRRMARSQLGALSKRRNELLTARRAPGARELKQQGCLTPENADLPECPSATQPIWPAVGSSDAKAVTTANAQNGRVRKRLCDLSTLASMEKDEKSNYFHAVSHPRGLSAAAGLGDQNLRYRRPVRGVDRRGGNQPRIPPKGSLNPTRVASARQSEQTLLRAAAGHADPSACILPSVGPR